MARSAWLRVTSVGIFAGSLVVSFLGCYGDQGITKGTCVDDFNPCTADSCDANGNSTSTPEADGSQCFLGGNEGVCSGGTCELTCKMEMAGCKCATVDDCPAANVCASWACTMGQCVSTTMTMDGMEIDPLDSNDCKHKICQSGSIKTVEDGDDFPEDIVGDCKDPVCNGQMPGQAENNLDVPADMPGDCQKPVCTAGTPGTADDNMDTPGDTVGDCKISNCKGGKVVDEVDMADPPAETECQTFSCKADGTIPAMDKAIGTACATGACDTDGMCKPCLTKADWDKCKMLHMPEPCPVPKCNGQACGMDTECATDCNDSEKVCCDTTCTDECKSCLVDTLVGTCTNIPFYEVDKSYTDPVFMTPDVKCEATSLCNGMGKCLKIVGAGCAMDSQCMSGKCAMLAKVCLGAKDEPCSNNAQCASMVCNAAGFCN